jgi:hypothetical protein
MEQISTYLCYNNAGTVYFYALAAINEISRSNAGHVMLRCAQHLRTHRAREMLRCAQHDMRDGGW